MTLPLTIENLSISFGRGAIEAVRGVSLELRSGEILALVGESGSGKSLTARSILKIFPEGATVSGRISLTGEDVLAASPSDLARLRGAAAAMVFQEPSTALNPVFTIGWQIAEGLKAHGICDQRARRNRAIELLRDVDIPDPQTRVDYYPHQLSGGQKQRVVIAMALALRPALIIADEPTTALDVTVQAGILDLLRRCRDELGTSILIITHNLGVVADLADRVAVMYQGRIVEEAPSTVLFASPKADYTRRLLAAVPLLGQSSGKEDFASRERLILEADHLEITYPGRFGRTSVPAVKGVTFDIAAGEILGLVGESGSGKSTIGRAVVGLSPVTGGAMRLFGADLRHVKGKSLRELRRRTGFVFQDPASSFNGFMTVFDCIAEPLRVHRALPSAPAVRSRVLELLDQVQLPSDMAWRYPGELSGGQRQRVGLARALALNPEFIVADEPTSALDVSIQAKVLELFKTLQKELGFAALFISHDLAVVEEISHRVGVLRHGKLLELGSAREVMSAPRHDYTRLLINSVPVPDPAIQAEKRARSVA
ncbi:dipeptide ABC transporter ATP-binding protein [Mesorhizobium helmanticense]|uniref:Glutathione ABC transporter ATP-binding protein n=1 Tax=Mesorhizobium helmanticense TaxID=1776423 RepID=A0A2T4IKT8_9HYPH|nr:ABC transporter ATP-binding protein [Mesorhizobium helmanticense]PTE06250.1 glutathione ABC transporter ATP-binding protein [Mesorhizobium helmanticense]